MGIKDGTIRLKSGVYFNPLSPDPSLITIEDIAYGLAGQNRFASHSRLTVAQHSVLGSRELGGEFALTFLLHDAEEGLGLPDLARPIKHSPSFKFYREAGERLQEAVFERFNLIIPFSHLSIKETDDKMFRTEASQLMSVGGEELKEDSLSLEVFPIKIEVWSAERAEREFLEQYHLLVG